MKSMAHIYHRQQAYARTKAGQRMGKREADNIIRKNYAMVLKVLHDEFGFGPERLLRFMDAMDRFCEEANKDELWFDIVAAWLKDYIKVDFYKDDWMEVQNGEAQRKK